MNVFVACEFSGVVRDRFLLNPGTTAVSCDLLPSDSTKGKHFQEDVLEHLDRHSHTYDLMIAHPPCTHLAVSGARWWKDRQKEQKAAINFFMALMEAPIHRICLENPVGIMSSAYRKPDQYVQPWMFGHPETKKTGLWFKNLPLLEETNNVKADMMALPKKEANRIHYMSPGPERSKKRSVTYQGIANAMAEQWSGPWNSDN